MKNILWLIVIALVVLWALGAFVVNLGSLVHLLIIVVLVLVVLNLTGIIGGRRRGHN